ncbi:MAG: TatD family hydrolase [Pseudomonadota bacterium]
MFLVDSHCHLDQLDLTAYDGELKNALAFAEKQGVGHMLCVCITLEHFPAVLRIAQTYPQVSASVGLHPNERNIIHEPTAADLIALAQDEKVVAIGETGLDYFRSEGELEWQRDRFRQHIRAANKLQKPLIIHMRDATDDTFAILREEQAGRAVMHCFTGDWEAAKIALDMGFYISLSGIVTFRNAADIQEVAKNLPLDRLLIETDSPYLAPVPFRGKPNEPAYVRQVAECIAGLRGVSLEMVAERTTANFFTLFNEAQQHV